MNRTLKGLALLLAAIWGLHLLYRIFPDLQAPTQGALADVWHQLSSTTSPTIDVSAVILAYKPDELLLQNASAWMADSIVGRRRGSSLRYPLSCPLSGWAAKEVRCEVSVGDYPCLFSLEVTAFSNASSAPVTKLVATAKKGC